MLAAFTGLFALGLVVLPGISYRTGREVKYPARRLRGFRETALLIFPGFVATFVGLAIFGAIRLAAPSHTPDVGRFLEDPGPYFRIHLPYMVGWFAAIIAISCVLAFYGGVAVTWMLERGGRTQKSSWAYLLDRQGVGSYLQCFLVDGSVVSGYLLSFNDSHEETLDRDLCLEDPWYWPTTDAETPQEWDDGTATAIINASRILFIAVTHFDDQGYTRFAVLDVGDA